MEKKRKHHFVWRDYLRSWSSSKDLVYTLFKSQNKIHHPNLISVAQQRDFNALHEFTIEQEIILEELVRKYTTSAALDLNIELYNMYTAYSQLKRMQKQNIFKDPHKKLESLLDLTRTNLFEDFHTRIENNGQALIKITNFEDLKVVENLEYQFDLLLFLCFQLLRTKKMRNDLNAIFVKSDFIIPQYTNLIVAVFATSFAISLAGNEKIKFTMLENVSDSKFITSDQPLANLLINDRDEKGNVRFFKLYYPINPTMAMLVHFEDQPVKYIYRKAEDDEIKNLNNFVFANAEELLFGATSTQLEQFLNEKVN
jgi:hypothetical protein